VVIPCFNESHWIAEVLDALAAQDRQPDDVVVVDDGSTDGTRDVVHEWRREHASVPLRLVAGPGRGVAAAVNIGVVGLATEVVVRLDGHCRPAPDYLRRTVELAATPGAGVAGGAWTIEPGAPSIEAMAIAIAVEHPLGSGGAAYRHPPAGSSAAGPLVVDTVPFGCFRKSLWQDLGGLDERLRSNEDYDFNFRARARGLKVLLDPSIRCTYYARPTVWTLARQYGRYGWWKARMLRHHPFSIRWRQLVPALLVPGLAVAAAGMIFRHKFIWALAIAAYLATVAGGAVHAAARRRAWPAVGWIAAAFLVVHVMWSAGFWVSLVAALPGEKADGRVIAP
jgi:GT2 family glycosyltransferase